MNYNINGSLDAPLKGWATLINDAKHVHIFTFTKGEKNR